MNVSLETKVQQRTMILRETLTELEKSKEELASALESEKEVNSLIGNVADHEQEIGKLKVSNNIPKYTCTKCHRSYSNLAEHNLMCPNQ